ncbi:MAG: hypothetical protein AAF899_02015 [Pseudomonadota bacterium]
MVTLVTLMAAMFVYYHFSEDRSLVLEARTESLRVNATERTAWRLPGATVCAPLPFRPERRTPAAPETDTAPADRPASDGTGAAGPCGDVEMATTGVVTIRWAKHDVFEARRRGLGGLEIVLREPSAQDREERDREETDETIGVTEIAVDNRPLEVPDGGRIVVPTARFADLGALPFQGKVSIGSAIEDGGRGVLLDGRVEWREVFWLRSRSERVREERLFRGDVVSIKTGAGDRAEVSGFISPADPEQLGMYVAGGAGSQTSSQRPLLELIRHGFLPTRLEPSWSNRALADQFVLAVVALVTAGVTLLTLVNGLHDALVGSDPAEPPTGEPQKGEPAASPHETQGIGLQDMPREAPQAMLDDAPAAGASGGASAPSQIGSRSAERRPNAPDSTVLDA